MQPFVKFAAAVAVAIWGTSAAAVPVVNIGTDATQSVFDIVKPSGLFSWLGGAEVTFTLQGGSSVTQSWAAGGGAWGVGEGCGGVTTGSGISLGGCGDTYIAAWNMANESLDTIETFVVDLTPTGHFFDRTYPSTGTPGSSLGADFSVLGAEPGSTGTISVTYAGIGNRFHGDLWQVLSVDLLRFTSGSANAPGGLATGATLTFRQDTDAPIPLPGTFWQLLGAAGCLAALQAASIRRLKAV